MSKDPFEELFGSHDAEEEPKPVPARERLAHEQAERVRTAPLPTKPAAEKPVRPSKPAKRDVAGGAAAGGQRRGISATAKPWIVVGLVTVVALIASIVVMNLARAGDGPSTTAAPTETTASQPATSKPATTSRDDDDDEEDETPGDRVPAVEVGPTNTMPIGPWNATSELSQRFGTTYFEIPDGANLTLTSDLLNSFPDSCADMRTAWGAAKTDAGYEVRKPATRCQAAPELYDEVWGLVDAWVRTIQ